MKDIERRHLGLTFCKRNVPWAIVPHQHEIVIEVDREKRPLSVDELSRITCAKEPHGRALGKTSSHTDKGPRARALSFSGTSELLDDECDGGSAGG